MAKRSVIGTAGNGSTAAGRDVHAVDRTIIEASIADPEQFSIIFRRHAAEIQRYVTRWLGADAADGVVAETFLAAFRQRSRSDISYPDARPWLHGIATNLIGRQRRAPQTVGVAIIAQVPVSGPGVQR
jgi:DNA-directed RNA polymerase specialized sigma24 family protein